MGGDGSGDELSLSTNPSINGIKVGFCLFNGAEGVAAEMSVHIEGGDEAVIDDFPLGSVQGLSVDNGRGHILCFSFPIAKIIQKYYSCNTFG